MKIKNLIPVFMTSIWYARCSSGFNSGAGQSSDIGFLHNLMNSLAAQVVRIRNFAKRQAIAAHLNNFGISVVVCRGPWLQGTPCPTRQLLQSFNFLCSQNALLVPLTHVAHPSPEAHFSSINDFNVKRRNAGVPRALSELGQCLYIKFESGVVIHARTI